MTTKEDLTTKFAELQARRADLESETAAIAKEMEGIEAKLRDTPADILDIDPYSGMNNHLKRAGLLP